MKPTKKFAAFIVAATMIMGSSMTTMAATAQDVISKSSASYTAGTNSVYGSKLTQDQLNAVANVAADFATNYVNSSMDNDAKIRAAYNYIKNNVTYIDWRESDYANSAYGCLVEKKAACSGMTRAFVALMDAVDVKAYWIHATDNSHQWNMVEFNDGFYFIDIDANIASGGEFIYKAATHPYAYDTASYPAIGSKSGVNTATSGWKLEDGIWYYYDGNGNRVTNQWIDGTYYVDSNGAMLTNTTTPDGYQVGSDGAWIRNSGAAVNDGVHTKAMSDPTANMDIDVNVIEERVDTNGNPYVLVSEDTTTISFTGALSNVNPANLKVSFATYRYNPDTNTIYPFSNDGTAVWLDFEYDKIYDIQIANVNLRGRDLVEYCKQHDLLIAINASDDNNNLGIMICYK